MRNYKHRQKLKVHQNWILKKEMKEHIFIYWDLVHTLTNQMTGKFGVSVEAVRKGLQKELTETEELKIREQ